MHAEFFFKSQPLHKKRIPKKHYINSLVILFYILLNKDDDDDDVLERLMRDLERGV